MADNCLEQFTIEVPQTFHGFVDGALLRLQGQYPRLQFKASDAGIEVGPIRVSDLDELRKHVSHAVYREKIYRETLTLREALISAVTTR